MNLTNDYESFMHGKVSLSNCPTRDEISIAAGRFREIELHVKHARFPILKVMPNSLTFEGDHGIKIRGPVLGSGLALEFVAQLKPESRDDVGWIEVVKVPPVSQ